MTAPRKLGDERRLRLLVQLLRRPHLLDAAPVEHDHLVGNLERLLLVVRDEQAGHVNLVVQAAQPGSQLFAHLGVEGAERLVQQQDLGPRRQRPRQRHPLALAAGKLRRISRGVARSAAPGPAARRPARGSRPSGAFRTLQAERDVLSNRHVAEQRVVLKDKPDASMLNRHGRGVFAGQLDRARLGRLQSGDDPQDRALARAGGPEQGHELAGRNVERDVVHRLKCPVSLREMANGDGHGVSF